VSFSHAVKLSQEVYEALRVYAAKEHRTITAQLEHMLREHPEVIEILTSNAKGKMPSAETSLRGIRSPLVDLKNLQKQ